MDKQSGGSFTVSGWLALTMLAVLAAVSMYTVHLLHHRAIEIKLSSATMQLGPTVIRPTDDNYVTHAWPEGREVCTSFDTICYTRI
jgi:hypothetical protein